MKDQEFISIILIQIDITSSQIRETEEQSRRFGLDMKSNPIYVALKGYKLALEDILREYKKLG